MLPDLQVQGNLSSINFFGVGFYSINSGALKERQTRYNIYQAKHKWKVLLTLLNLSTKALIKYCTELHVKYEHTMLGFFFFKDRTALAVIKHRASCK